MEQQDPLPGRGGTDFLETDDELNILPADFEPGKWDVICRQRGKECYQHTGNQSFRQVVENQLDSYRSSKSRRNKSKIVDDIVESIARVSSSQSGTGFVRKDLLTQRWYTVGGKVAREKVSQALRDAIKTRRASEKKDVRIPKRAVSSHQPRETVLAAQQVQEGTDQATRSRSAEEMFNFSSNRKHIRSIGEGAPPLRKRQQAPVNAAILDPIAAAGRTTRTPAADSSMMSRRMMILRGGDQHTTTSHGAIQSGRGNPGTGTRQQVEASSFYQLPMSSFDGLNSGGPSVSSSFPAASALSSFVTENICWPSDELEPTPIHHRIQHPATFPYEQRIIPTAIERRPLSTDWVHETRERTTPLAPISAPLVVGTSVYGEDGSHDEKKLLLFASNGDLPSEMNVSKNQLRDAPGRSLDQNPIALID